MSKRQFLCLLGIWVMFFLFIGFPSSWQKSIALVTGLTIAYVAYNLQQERRVGQNETSFVESDLNKINQ